MEKLKEKVLQANLDLVKNKLVLFTWGNVSEIDRESNLIVIKPSGVSYDDMTAEDMVVVDLNGKVVEGKLRPSSDTPTHIEFYKAFPNVGGVTHTHSTFATSWAQAGRDIPFYGTTHADYFYGDIPCARSLTKEEIEGEYEKNTGLVIIERFKKDNLNPIEVPGVLIKSHGVFAFGKDADGSVYNATVIEEVAKMAFITEQVNPNVQRADKFMMDKHYLRKHGKNAYYGQNRG
ncbi:MAG TPA: L-ribulose-5-phosphate 4-epimerase [Candidatus Borkfalkia avistercoris]|uniref:L-ribulose-5-phosphate 4-epimerase n=1 Tax=Candidatus Borkfalkia avistercoris TaxID=2838504 RepID=A0A9D2CYF6_9FIRM|nr:L-ribulose-5-phosphate 4-epimerase [Candidatus Borkfalkia avistercoris]